ncbi:GntR family transcriptional regulator [Marinoscillum sp. MHG1-6]|uniref:GntR family transcriptional regulator n=1 Tax=Marinoscillum sp. MHG1-6 TaxID=2959627 RepID=UPI002157CCDA|nr:GntR family transcriptional regulator [Marinoscillum sp. MHG1-6]
MEGSISLEISDESSTPKYKQIVFSVINKIETGHIKYGQKLPSINKLSFDYYLARDTVEKAYNELKDRGVIESVKGKGYYVRNSTPTSKVNVLILFNKLSAYKKEIFNAISRELEGKANIDFFVYHYDYETFERILTEHLKGYSYYVIMPHFTDFEPFDLNKLLKMIPKEKIILLDNQIEGVDHYGSIIYQDFKLDIYDAMVEASEFLNKYDKLVMVFPENGDYPYPKEIVVGFRRYCGFNNKKHEILNELNEHHEIKANSAYILIEESDLVALIKLQRSSGLSLGKDIGILSYNDTLLKEVLAEGISVITTDFVKMGSLAAKCITSNEAVECKNDFRFIQRNSL